MNFYTTVMVFMFSLVPPALAADTNAALQPTPYPVRQTGSTPSVRCWERFEASFENTESSADPFRDVTLDAVFTRPGGEEIAFWGFHDGGSTWRLRFMPDRIGTWNYRAQFSDGSEPVTGTFECVASDLTGPPVAFAPNPFWFGTKDGRDPLLLRSFHVGDCFFARNWDDPDNPNDGEKRSAFLDWAQAQGYNTLSIASHFLNRDEPGRGRGWETPDLWPLNPGEFQRLETLLDELDARRIIVFPFAGFFGRASDYPRDPAEQELYLRYTLARFGPYWNLILNVAGPEPNHPKIPYLSDEEVNRLGRQVRQLDVFGHALTQHNRTGDDPFRDSDWTTFGTLQGPKTLDRAVLGRDLLATHHPAKPLYAQETLWPGNKYHPAYTDDDVRRNGLVLLFSGAMINFADMAGDSSSGFSGTLDLEDKVQSRHDSIKHVWDFFATLPYGGMRPRPELVSTGYCLAKPGRDYIVYLDEASSVDVTLDGSRYAVEWINARDFTRRHPGAAVTNGYHLTPPSPGDWLVRLTLAPFAQPIPITPQEERTHSVFEVKPDHSGTLLNGKPFLVAGLRFSNALISDAATRQLIEHLDEFAGYGVNTISVFIQGSRFGDLRGYREDATLDPSCAERLVRLIEAADARHMVVLVGCLYHGTSEGWWRSWEQADAERAVANTVRWLSEHDYRNVFVDVNNEHMADFDDAQLIAAGKAVDARVVIATGGPITPANADLSLHFGRSDLADKYYIETEGTGSDYWGDFSRQAGLYDYINIGVYSDAMKAAMLKRTDQFLDRGQGYLFASTWLQCPPPNGPHHVPGGKGTQDDPGVRWWLDHLRARVGPYHP